MKFGGDILEGIFGGLEGGKCEQLSLHTCMKLSRMNILIVKGLKNNLDSQENRCSIDSISWKSYRLLELSKILQIVRLCICDTIKRIGTFRKKQRA